MFLTQKTKGIWQAWSFERERRKRKPDNGQQLHALVCGGHFDPFFRAVISTLHIPHT
jgi:hypothetical protein